MSDRADKDGKNRLLLGAGSVIIVVAVAIGAYLGWRASVPAVDRAPLTVLQAQLTSAQLLRRDEPLSVRLYYPVNCALATGSAAIKRQSDTQAQAREMLSVFLTDQRAAQVAVLNAIKVQDLYLDASGTAYVDLVLSQQKELKASAGEEFLAIYAMADTLMLNFEEIKQVMFLLDGREARTLAGHMDLTRKFLKRTDLVKQ